MPNPRALHELMELVPLDVLTAIARGWRGVTIVETGADGGPPALVCVAHEAELRELRGGALSITAPDGANEHSLVLGLESPAGPGADGPLGVSLDLAHPAARELVERIAAHGALRLAWVPCDRESWVLEHVDLGARGSAHLRAAAARAAEWHAEEPALRLCERRWEDARARAPRLIAAAGAPAEVLVVVPPAVLQGVEGRPGRMTLASRLVAPCACDADLELHVIWDGEGEAAVSRQVGLALDDPGQRALAARLAAQRHVVVLAPDGAGSPSAALRAALGPCARHLVAEAVRAAARLDADGSA